MSRQKGRRFAVMTDKMNRPLNLTKIDQFLETFRGFRDGPDFVGVEHDINLARNPIMGQMFPFRFTRFSTINERCPPTLSPPPP